MKKTFILALAVFMISLLSCSDDKDPILYTLKTDLTTLSFNNYLNVESQTFSIKTNDSWTISLEENEWLVIDKTNGDGDATIKVSTQANVSDKERNLKLIIKEVNNKENIVTINVNQTFNKEKNILDYIPDPIFKKYLIEDVFNNVKHVSREMAQKITLINVDGSESAQIESLEGIQYFTSLTELDCRNNKVTTLDISKNLALVKLNCKNNQLTTLDVSKNTELVYLSVNDNQLTTLDVSKNTKLVNLYCDHNQLSTLDVSNNPELFYLYFEGNQLTTLDVSKNTELLQLNCINNKLTTLDVSKNTRLFQLNCDGNQLIILDLINNVVLGYLTIANNNLGEKSIKVTKNQYRYLLNMNTIIRYDRYLIVD